MVELVGRDVALDLFQQTRKIEGGGGMMIKNGSRRRTPGGLYLQLLRDRAKEDHRIDEIKVRYRGNPYGKVYRDVIIDILWGGREFSLVPGRGKESILGLPSCSIANILSRTLTEYVVSTTIILLTK